jgi:Hint-domain
MQHFIQRLVKLSSTSCLMALALSGQVQAAAWPAINRACLPHRIELAQTADCHCPPEELGKCDDPTTPGFVKTLCCEEAPPPPPPGGLCTQNGCPSGWQYAMVQSIQQPNNIPVPLFYCAEEPDCGAIFDAIPLEHNGQPINILERTYNWPEREAVETNFNIIPDISQPNNTIPGSGWICDASPLLDPYQPTNMKINPQTWVMPQIKAALGVTTDAEVCVIPAFPDGNCFALSAMSPEHFGPCVPSQDCLPGETKVVLEDGTEKPIQEVKIGDKLKAQSSVNTVLEILVNKSDKRSIYSINGGELTITEGHPLLTLNGWVTAGQTQSLVNADKKHWSGRPLKAGDTIVGRDKTIKDVKEMDTYNLRLSGDNAFLANGAIVQGFDSVEVIYGTQKKDAKK